MSPGDHSHLLPEIPEEIQDIPQLVGEAASRSAGQDAATEGGEKLRQEGTQLIHTLGCPRVGERPHLALDGREQVEAETPIIVALGGAGTRGTRNRRP